MTLPRNATTTLTSKRTRKLVLYYLWKSGVVGGIGVVVVVVAVLSLWLYCYCCRCGCSVNVVVVVLL